MRPTSSPSPRRPAVPGPADPPLRASTTALRDGTRILRLTGEVTPDRRGALHRALRDALRTGPPLLVVDLTALGFCDSNVLNALLATRLDARAAGVPLVLAGPPPQTLRLLRLTGTDQVLAVRPTLADCLAPAPGPRSVHARTRAMLERGRHLIGAAAPHTVRQQPEGGQTS
jgi:anti-sigma B factor antagonist